jgi:Cu(I)/Ag(I) efflux system membrane fusion protein
MSRRVASVVLALAASIAAGTAGYYAGRRGLQFTDLAMISSQPLPEAPAAVSPVTYYRDPDGKPFYAAEPRKAIGGRDYLPVHASEDISFEHKPTAVAEDSAISEPKRILYYRNPMGLADTSPAPKKDSMGMDYIPVYAGDDEDGTTVKVAPGKLQRTGVRSEIAADHVIVRHLRVPGAIEVDERRVTIVSVPSDSFIAKVENVTTGDHVRKGQPLLQLYSAEIAAAAAQLMINPGYEGSHRRLQNLNVPAEVIAEIERNHEVPLAFSWSSPRDGVVLERNATEGMKAPAGVVLFRIADISTVWVLADVSEHDLAAIEPGRSAAIRIRGLPGRTFSGRVTLIYPSVAKATRTTKVRIELANPDQVLLPNMYAEVEIAAGTETPVVAVPDSAVIDTGTRQIVILDKGDGRFEPREVAIGTQGEGFTEIRNGIASGDKVVVSANFLIDAESNLKAALSGMSMAESKP